MRWMIRPRSDGVIRRQSERSSSKHRRAAATARSTSAASPWATEPRLCSVAGSKVSNVLPETASTQLPSMRSLPVLPTMS